MDGPSERIQAIRRQLKKHYPQARCTLDFANPLELLVATILAAQCTDKRVNQITPALFKKYRTPSDYANVPQARLERQIRSAGFFRNKAKQIRACGAVLDKEHGGQVPANLEALVKLPGVGRKTANVILGNAFGIPGLAVDTHVRRLSQRLGLTTRDDPIKIELDLMKLVPKKEWTDFSHRLIFHGREVCFARQPKCDACPLRQWCPWPETQK